ncbi:acyltransferase [Pantoea sp. M_5]|uniref:acyltransferase n=1 Tax=Pantoea sp. M_5 TaxID=2608038 RepID=UPI001CC1CDDE|nr:acyltransferase [Pantoea sp. M_5]
MNKSGLAMLKTLACITAVSFFTLYQSYDRYYYDVSLTLNVLSFVSTIATPLYFLLSGYMDAGEQPTPAWQLGRIRRILLIFLFWFSFFWLAGMHHKGYLIQPWFVIALIVIYVSHPLIDRLVRRPGVMALLIFLLLLFAFTYDLLASLSIFLFWFSFFWLAGMHHKGYLIQPWFVIALIVIYVSHPLIDRLVRRPGVMALLIFLLLLFAFTYDLLASLSPERRLFSLPPQYRIWTWVLYYLSGRLIAAPAVMPFFTSPRVIKTSLLLLPAVYLFTWLYERYYFIARFLATSNEVLLTGSQVYLLVILIVISINAIRLPARARWVTPLLTTLGKTMTGVYILHYLIFGLLAAAIRIETLGDKLLVIALTLIFSMTLSLLLLRIPGVRKLISL